jgi:hypothetical protein
MRYTYHHTPTTLHEPTALADELSGHCLQHVHYWHTTSNNIQCTITLSSGVVAL